LPWGEHTRRGSDGLGAERHRRRQRCNCVKARGGNGESVGRAIDDHPSDREQIDLTRPLRFALPSSAAPIALQDPKLPLTSSANTCSNRRDTRTVPLDQAHRGSPVGPRGIAHSARPATRERTRGDVLRSGEHPRRLLAPRVGVAVRARACAIGFDSDVAATRRSWPA
jgi:hypothetical protein